MCRPTIFLLLFSMAASTLAFGQSSSTATGVSRAMNPAVSVNGLFWGQVSRDNDSPEFNRVALQEAEAQFAAVVDPFWAAVFTFAVHPTHSHEAGSDTNVYNESAEEPHGFALDVEEAYVDGQSLPAGLGLRLGKFYLPFGKWAPLHTHQFPFAVSPLAVAHYLGEHSLTEPGGMMTLSVPLPWYSDLQLYGVNGDSELFDRSSTELVWGGRWRNMWDVSDNATLELAGSGFTGPDGAFPDEGRQLYVYGADLTYKWVSAARSQGPILVLTGEVILPRPQEREGDPYGWYALANYRFRRNWWLGVTVGQVDCDTHHEGDKQFPILSKQHEHEQSFPGDTWEYKANLTYAPSEFSALRFEVDYYEDRVGDADDLRFIVQVNFTIGSHPAHLY